jgi:hypothetical protein
MDTVFWQHQLDAFTSAPLVFLFSVAVGASAAWWFRGVNVRGQIEGLKAQADNHKAEIAVLEERLKFAAQIAQERDDAKERLEADIEKLGTQINANASQSDMASTSKDALENLIVFNDKDDEVKSLLLETYLSIFQLVNGQIDPPGIPFGIMPPGFVRRRRKKSRLGLIRGYF